MDRGRRLVLILESLAVLCALDCAGTPQARPSDADSAVRGGVLRMVQEAPRSLDPLAADSVYESLPINQIYDTLVEFDPSLNLVPALADTWMISRDGLTYTFHVRQGVRFHDGEPLRADDVAFSILRHLDPARTGDSLELPYLLAIDGAEDYAAGRRSDLPGLRVAGPDSLSVRLARPSPSFLDVLAMDGMSVLPRGRFLELGAEGFGRAPSGTGPFRLDRWDPTGLVLEANEDYFGGAPLLDEVDIDFLRDGESDFGTERFFDGEIDVLEPPTDALDRLERDRGVSVLFYQELSLAFLGLNERQPPLDLAWVRQAVAMAIDRHALVEGSPRVRREAVGVLPPGIAGYSPEPKTLPHDPDAARELLAEYGHPGGTGIPPIRLLNASKGQAVAAVVERIRADLAAVGLLLEVEDVSWGELGDAFERGDAPAFLLGWVADLPHPDAFMRALFESGGAANYFGHSSPRTDELLRLGVEQRNPVEQARIYRELERHVLSSAPIVPLYHTRGVVAVRRRVHGIDPGPLGLAKLCLERVWLSPESAP